MSGYSWQPKDALKILFLLSLMTQSLVGVIPVFASVIIIEPGQSKIEITSATEYFLDRNETFNYEQLTHKKFQPIPTQDGNFGYLKEGVWLRFSLGLSANYAAERESLSLELAFPLLSVARLVYQQSDGTIFDKDIGYDNNFSDRVIAFRNPTFPITLDKNKTTTFYLNVKRINGSIRTPINVWSNNAFFNNVTKSNYIIGAIFSIYLLMAVYNLFLYASIKDSIYLIYSFYILFTNLTIISLTGQGFELLWPNNPGFNNVSLQFGACGSIIFLYLFTQRFLSIRKHLPKYNAVINACIGYFTLLSALVLFTDYYYASVVTFSIGPGAILLLVTVFMLRKATPRKVNFYALAFGAVIVGAIVYGLTAFKLIPYNAITQNAYIFGSVAEIVILSLALADRIKYEQEKSYNAVIAQRDALFSLEKAKNQLYHSSTHHHLTNLPNLSIFKESINESIKNEKPFSLLIINLGNFHQVNKTLGHKAGDELIVEYSRILKEKITQVPKLEVVEINKRVKEYVSQLDMSSFGIKIREGIDGFNKNYIAQISSSVPKEVDFQNMKIDLQPNIGIACFPEHGGHFEQLLKSTNIATEFAEEEHTSIYIYDNAKDPYSEKRLTLMSELRSGIRNNELVIYLQPQIDIKKQTVYGVELLVRWQHPKRGLLMPNEFIPAAERSSLINDLTAWVVGEAKTIMSVFKIHGQDINLSINIAAANLRDSSFIDMLLENFIDTKDRKKVILEITETSLMYDMKESNIMLAHLSKLGFKVSLDDFGTGYSSMSYLQKLPLNEMKIDRSFIKDMNQTKDNLMIVKAILNLSQSLGLISVAEGIEDIETLKQLDDLGCDIAQGYLFSKPVPAESALDIFSKIEAQLNDQAKSYA